MCGIAGTIGVKARRADREILRAMTASLSHRGPDATGFFFDHEAGLGHARLSILDLSGGAQPMSTEDGRFTITFNGEIFNYVELREELQRRGHVFRTRSDTEVILHCYQEYGPECVLRFNGQWAFGIWDAHTRELFLSRDRMGIQPLFYTRTDDAFLFASEIKALLAHPATMRELDLRGLDQIFTFWVTIPPRTAFRDISQLPPGCNLVLRDGVAQVSEYWAPDYSQVEESDAFDPRRVHTKAEELDALLADAVRLRLRADIPVGAYLSGGLDSSYITALAHDEVRERLRTFSVGFEDPGLDETSYQQAVSRHLGTEHSSIRCTAQAIGEVFPEVMLHAEQPLLRTAPAPLFKLSQLVSDSGFRVVLTGEGADEVLGGYDIFKEAKLRRFWARQPGSRMRPALLRRLYPYMPELQKQPSAYLSGFFQVRGTDLANPFFSHLPRFAVTSKIKSLYSAQTKSVLDGYDSHEELLGNLPASYFSWPDFCQAQFLEMKYLLPGYLLSAQADRMAMAHSVEARYPFLDYRVVDFCQKLDPGLKMRVLAEKFLLKAAARPKLPEVVLQRPKQPYRAPNGLSFLSQNSPCYVAELLSHESVKREGIFEASPVSALIARLRSSLKFGTRDDMAVVGIVSTSLLMRQFMTSKRVSAYAVN